VKYLIFTFVDHFEPRAPADVEAWVKRYPDVAGRFTDSAGRHPLHTWFYDGADPEVLTALGGLCRRKLGEIEVHVHHAQDTPTGFREKLERRKRVYSQYGALVTSGADALKTFGFIHGKWSLDNSRGDEHCGVNNELIVLKEAGCYADFTFPAWGRMQPSKRQSIYYATDDPARAKSYDTGVDVEVGKDASGDLMIFQGPGKVSGIPRRFGRWRPVTRLLDRLWLTCAVDGHLPPWPDRVDRWVDANVHVQGRADWVFVKVHTHGALPENYGAYFDQWADMLHSHLARRYNEEQGRALVYATAREAYNIVKAAEAGAMGDPAAFRDFAIKPYQNTV
jgi:hypothetical protein